MRPRALTIVRVMPSTPLRSKGHAPLDEHPDRKILMWAERQRGVVARRQLLGDGVPPNVIDRRLKSGWLRAIHRGVYRVGPFAASGSQEIAALLACGDRAALSHRTAATLWEFAPPPSRAAPVDVISPSTIRGPSRGVRVHRVRVLDLTEVTTRRGLRVTTPPRTLVDFAATAKPAAVERALAQAERRGLATVNQMKRLLVEHPYRRGNAKLAVALGLGGGPSLTRSEAEVLFLSLVRRAELPLPRTNVVVEGLEVDILWRRERLVVEIDGFAFHGGRAAFERDRERDVRLTAAGFRVIRVTWRQLKERPEPFLVRLGRALAVKGPKT
ncbi:MAG: type IV toxin-antitoxin system AbiEi family antitoxin domain-containing protein [Longimicrobiales bacterium]